MNNLIFVTTNTTFSETEAHIVVQELSNNEIREFSVQKCDCACAVEFAMLTAIEMANEKSARDIVIVHNKDNEQTRDIEKFFHSLVGKVEFVYVQNGFFDYHDSREEMIEKIEKVMNENSDSLAKEAYWYLMELSDIEKLRTLYLFLNDDFAKDVILKVSEADTKVYAKPDSMIALNTIYNLLSSEYQEKFIEAISEYLSSVEINDVTTTKDTEDYLSFLKSLKEISKVFFKTVKQNRQSY